MVSGQPIVGIVRLTQIDFCALEKLYAVRISPEIEDGILGFLSEAKDLEGALFIFLEDRRRMELSARTRGWQGSSGRRALALVVSRVGSLLVRSMDRTEKLWHAMRSRAFAGEFPLPERFKIGVFDVVTFGALVLVVVLLVTTEYLVQRSTS